jgi:predicted nucleic acid-binding protein
MKVVLDTSVLLGPDPGLIDGDVAISAISLAELHFGVLNATSPAVRAERLRRLGVIEKTFDALPVDVGRKTTT